MFTITLIQEFKNFNQLSNRIYRLFFVRAHIVGSKIVLTRIMIVYVTSILTRQEQLQFNNIYCKQQKYKSKEKN